jgi:hypothetical protein
MASLQDKKTCREWVAKSEMQVSVTNRLLSRPPCRTLDTNCDSSNDELVLARESHLFVLGVDTQIVELSPGLFAMNRLIDPSDTMRRECDQLIVRLSLDIAFD